MCVSYPVSSALIRSTNGGRRDGDHRRTATKTALVVFCVEYVPQHLPVAILLPLVEQAEVERTSVCFPFGKAFHAALTAQAWECMMGNSLRQDELVERFAEAFRIEAEATPNLIYKEGENYDSMVELASRMLDAVSANWSDCYTVKAVARAFKVEVPGLNHALIGEWDCIVQDGRDACIVDWKTSASRWPAGKADRDLQATVFSVPTRSRTLRLRSFGLMSLPRRRTRDVRATTPVAVFTTPAIRGAGKPDARRDQQRSVPAQ